VLPNFTDDENKVGKYQEQFMIIFSKFHISSENETVFDSINISCQFFSESAQK
jgi:hypothetical protein